MMVNLLQFFNVIFTAFITSEALICYHCRFCNDIFETKYIMEKDCSESFAYPTCEKIVFELSDLSRGVIVRRCQFTVFLENASTPTVYSSVGNQKYPFDYLNQYYVELAARQNGTRPFVRRISVFHCQSDYCNNASFISASVIIIFITVILLIL